MHTIAIQVPIKQLTRDGSGPTDPASAKAVLGVWARRQPAPRCKVDRRRQRRARGESGPWVQVSRLGNPLFNEVIVPIGKKDQLERQPARSTTRRSPQYVKHPELAKLLPVLYPGVFPNLAGLTADRADLVAILLTGLPAGHRPRLPELHRHDAGRHAAAERGDPAGRPVPNTLGILGGDLAGFPNGRRVADDVVTIELRAIAGRHVPAGRPSYTPDGAAPLVTDGLNPAPAATSRRSPTWARRTTASTRRRASGTTRTDSRRPMTGRRESHQIMEES